jgi:hypothetical protein
MSQALRPIPEPNLAEAIERVIATGDIGRLSAIDRIAYYDAVCESLRLNKITRPLEYGMMDGKMVLYFRKEATDQLRKIHNISVTKIEEITVGDLFKVIAHGKTPEGREDVDIAYVSLLGLKGKAEADARMKTITKAKRRLTLSLCGLGFPDESEVEGQYFKRPWSGGQVLAEPAQPAIAEGKLEDQPAEQAQAATPAEVVAESPDRLTREQLQRINDQIEELKRRGVTNTQFKQALIDNFGIDMRTNLSQEQADKFTVLCKDWIEELKQNEAERNG